jgi:hypothetical protein
MADKRETGTVVNVMTVGHTEAKDLLGRGDLFQ